MSDERANELSPNGVEVTGDGGNPPPPTPNWKEFLDGIQDLNRNLGTKLDGVRDTVTAATAPPPQPAPNFDEMSNAELAAHISGTLSQQVQEAIKAALAPVTEQLGKLGTDVSTTRGSIELKDVQGKYKDFRDWKDEMIALVGKHPTLGFEEVYQLARATNPKKAAELEAKYNPPAPKPKPFGFGGLTPGGNGKAAAGPVDRDEAAKAAYNEVLARHPGILPALQDL